jgi:DNA helicase-2/ATP-dependent DNA helicase PcrA
VSAEDPRTALDPAEQAAYDALRTWRNDRAKRSGKPSYALFNNRQMAELVRIRPPTVEALAALPGFGGGRLGDFGAELVGLLAGLPVNAQPAPAADAPAASSQPDTAT